MLLVLEAHTAFQDIIKLLPGMIRQMDGLILQLGTVIGGDEERLAQLVAIVRGLVQVLKAAATLDGQALIGTRKGVARQVRGFAGQQLDRVDAEIRRAFIQEGERKLLRPRFLRLILRQAAAGGVGHFLHGQAHILAQRADPVRHLLIVRLHVNLTSSHAIASTS